jgi:hypothetical protein
LIAACSSPPRKERAPLRMRAKAFRYLFIGPAGFFGSGVGGRP